MSDIGQLSLILALSVTLYTIVSSFIGSWRRIPELVKSGEYGFYTVPLLLAFPTYVLVHSFVVRDFSIRYVYENSDLAMPHAYTWVALYAGNAGSLLFLAVVLSIFSVLAIITMRRKLPHTTPYATGVLAIILAFFLTIIVFLANPLDKLNFLPADGLGINPLLIHFGMFIHPPLQMSGLVLVAVPFSISIGALLARRGGRDEWVDMGRLWGMISWLILTIGLLLGSWWAYTILGWGGYWAWDPVENSALMPWLAMTAFVHSVMVQKRRGMFRMWNMIIIIIAFTLAQMGMFINRGGPVPSVHSFAQSTMGWLFLMFMTVTLIISLAIFIWRLDSLKSRGQLESILSRESAFLAQNILFLTVAFVTLWGTIFPVFSEVASGDTMTIGQPYFNIINGPILLGIIFLMGVGPLIPWRRSSVRSLIRLLRIPVLVALATFIILSAAGGTKLFATISFATLSLALSGILLEWIRGTNSWHKRGDSYIQGYLKLVSRNRPRYGGYVVHIGIIMLASGITASSFYSVQKDIFMKPGDVASLGNYTFAYVDGNRQNYTNREEFIASFRVYNDQSVVDTLDAKRIFYPDFKIAATIGAIRSTPLEDFYIVPSEFNENNEAVFRVLINPMIWWMWASGPVIFLGVLIGLWPKRRSPPTHMRLHDIQSQDIQGNIP